METIDVARLQKAVADGFVQVQKHPAHDLYIYNYTPKTQYERHWNELTLACRGLILDAVGNIVARPFSKFFNLGEIPGQEMPGLPFEAYEKMDGSLGILYWIKDAPHIATRGSFTSPQARAATEILHNTFAGVIEKLDRTKTYLFEIIYPENRIVVDYGRERTLCLLAVIDTKTGAEPALYDFQSLGFPLAKIYRDVQDIESLRTREEQNKEGFVVRFQNGLRVKVKFDEYLRIHRLVTQVSNVVIWEHLKEGRSLDVLLDNVPDEFYGWVRSTASRLARQFGEIEAIAKREFKILDTRKACAEYYQTCANPPILFKMMDDRSYDYLIWKMIRPKFEKPFSTAGEENTEA